MVSLKEKYALLFVFLLFPLTALCGLNDPTLSKPVDPIPIDTPCTGGSPVSASECSMAGVPCMGQCYRAARNSWSGGVESFGFCYHCEGLDEIEIAFPNEDIEVTECNPGDEQFEADGDCGTKTNLCCSNGKWSGLGNSCDGASSCGSNQCWNGSICENKPLSGSCTCSNGTCSNVYTCVDGKGWKTGQNCKCNSGYSFDILSGGCKRDKVTSTELIYTCQLATSGSCRNPVNNRHDSPCESLVTTCKMEGEEKSYYSCHTCYNCVCTRVNSPEQVVM